MPVLDINPAQNEVDTLVVHDASDSEILRIDTVNKRLVHTDTCWDDLRFPLTRDKQGQTQKPDYDFTNMGLLFPQNDDDEIVYITTQMPHDWKQGSIILPHMHYIQDEVGTPTFKIDYRIYNRGDAVPVSFTTLDIDIAEYSYSSGSIHQMLEPTTGIDMTGYTISSLMDIKLYRDDNDVTGDVLGKEFDIHYQRDGFGSEDEDAKA